MRELVHVGAIRWGAWEGSRYQGMKPRVRGVGGQKASLGEACRIMWRINCWVTDVAPVRDGDRTPA